MKNSTPNKLPEAATTEFLNKLPNRKKISNEFLRQKYLMMFHKIYKL